MTFSPEDITALIRQGVPGAAGTGFRVEAVTPDGVLCRNVYDAGQLRPGGSLSGPTMMALADSAMYAAVLSRLGRVEMALTQNLNINFMRRPMPADLLARAEILKMGRRTVVMDVKIYSEGSPDVVAHATGTYALPPDGRA
ncbi:MAG: PaaI family thioesterase [Moraxellaceae bacterium]|nr:PaaI family thioesterase [Moraxellaceae bacterium]